MDLTSINLLVSWVCAPAWACGRWCDGDAEDAALPCEPAVSLDDNSLDSGGSRQRSELADEPDSEENVQSFLNVAICSHVNLATLIAV